MEGTCARAVELGLPSVAFTEHVDHTRWVVAPDQAARMGRHAERVGEDGRFTPPPLDVEGYQACLERCRERFPGLRIVSGAELGEPHWFEAETRTLLRTGAYERVLGSVHAVMVDGRPRLVDLLFDQSASHIDLTPAAIVRAYLREAAVMVSLCDVFGVLAHIDYPARNWPPAAGPFRSAEFEAEYREVLAALAASDRCLEVNTRLPLAAEVVGWWYEAGGDAVSFGSDAHTPRALARDFEVAAAMVEAHGFRPGRDRHDFWRRG
jgi:histidinol-phosphatase (PHP family)